MVGRATGEEAVVLHVAQQTPSLDLLADLYEVAGPLRQAGVRAKLRTLQGDPAAKILEETRRRHARWVVMGTRGQLWGPDSIAGAVIAAAPAPVLAVRPGSPGKLEIGSVSLWARPRSQAPQAWDIAGLLANLLNTHIEQNGVTHGSAGFRSHAEDALLILDLPNLQKELLSSTLAEERCRVLLVAPPH